MGTMEEHTTTQWKMFLKVLLFGFVILIFSFLVLYLRRAEFNLYIANKSVATASVILIGLSMALSGICAFWNFADTKLSYRKHLGLVGFGLGLAHYILTVGFFDGRFQLGWIVNANPAIWLAEIALLIFLIMAALSLFELSMIKKFGSEGWHKFLRLTGYTALILIAYHLITLKYNMWFKWLQTFDPAIPPLSLIAAVFIIFVLILRLALYFSKKDYKDTSQTDFKKSIGKKSKKEE